MQATIIQFLTQHWQADYASKIQFSPVPKGQPGDLAMNFFGLTKEMGQSPAQIGATVAEVLQNCDLVEKTEAAGPYLNLFFSASAFFANVISTPLQTKTLLNKNIVLEFSGPNTNKPLHLGHMRNHALGLSVGNVLEAAGASVHRVNIINDRGVHICKSMLAYQRFGNGETPVDTGEKGDAFVGRYYVKFDQESKKDESLKTDVQAMLVAWEAGDPEVRRIWKLMNDWTLAGHQATYDRQGVVFERRYLESEYYQRGKDIAQMGLQKGVFEKREDGAIVINFEDENLGQKVILRPDGTSIYLTQDLAIAVAREQDYNHPDQLIYTTASEQNYHFQVLFECLDRLGVMSGDKCYHLNYGLVNLPDGRMKSREGTVVDADQLMDQLHEIAAEKIRSNQDPLDKGDKDEFIEQEIYTIAEQVQNAAWKFYLLRTSPNKDITFDAAKSIDFHGATGPYLQYAGVRIKSILAKSGLEPGFYKQAETLNPGSVLGEAEKGLGVKILEWPETLNRAAEHYNSTYVVTYLLELAQEWSSFYATNSVLNADSEELKQGRLALAAKVLEVLEKGLEVLGIEVPDRM